MRFSQLQAAKTPDELLRTSRRLLKLMKGKVDPLTLAEDIKQWFSEHHHSEFVRAKNRICVKWAMDYYRAAK
ncbi:type I-E CRISPR-associated protein Cse2/CasB [Photobacterium angustum]|nr:type I-E CRISPR-associated protein Cse2/CasB [Photobacterium angustum]